MLHRKDIVFTKPPIFRPGIEEYATAHTSPVAGELHQIQQRTQRECPQWADIASTSIQAVFLGMLVSLAQARNVLEVGTFTGHGAVAMASALPADGRVVTVDSFVADEQARAVAKSAFDASPHGHKIRLVEGDALDVLGEVNGPFDIIFVDADKPNYQRYFDRIMQRRLLSPHGLLIFDNTLWGGAVTDPPPASGVELDRTTDADEWLRAMRGDWARHLAAFNASITADPRVENVLLTVRDGMTLIRHAR
ncbi:class I SAM-dependent methyltransferase [Micromonospora sp. NPDC049240]|uniref:O-methyltransferase n=1 Tax=Micromonospora sp. NPDC049240 TaxID=3155151 RepID=UPI0033F76655